MARKKYKRRRRSKGLGADFSALIAIGVVVFLLWKFVTSLASKSQSFLDENFGNIFASAVFVFAFLLVWFAVKLVVRIVKKIRNGIIEDRKHQAIKTVEQTKEIDPFLFEEFVGFLLRKSMGCTDVKVTERGNDKGVDITAKSSGKKIAVQVKRYQTNVQRPELQGFVGAYSNHDLKFDEGWFVTTSDYSKGAIEFANGVRSLRLIDNVELGTIINNLPDESWIEKFLTKPRMENNNTLS